MSRTLPRGMWTICDVCGSKIARNRTIYQTERDSIYYGLTICESHVLKVKHPIRDMSAYIERPPENPETIRTPQEPVLIDMEGATNTPSAPQNLVASLDTQQNYVRLHWQAPINQYSRMLGYIITRADPQESVQFTVEANTDDTTVNYVDTTSDINEFYTYSVAAINNAGIGEYSDLAYYPYDADTLQVGYKFLLESQTDYVITTGDGEYLIVDDS